MLIASFLSSVRGINISCKHIHCWVVNASIILVLLSMTSSFVGVYSSSYSHSKCQYRPVFDDASTFSDDDSITPIYVIPVACFNLSDNAFSSFLKVSFISSVASREPAFRVISALVIICSCWNRTSHCFMHKSSSRCSSSQHFYFFVLHKLPSLIICCRAILCDTQ